MESIRYAGRRDRVASQLHAVIIDIAVLGKDIRPTFSPAGSDGDLVPRFEDPAILGDGMMYLGLEHLEETGFTHLLSRLWTANEGFVRRT